MKVCDRFGGIPPEFGGHPKLFSLFGVAGILEFFGGFPVLLGFFAHPAALIISPHGGGDKPCLKKVTVPPKQPPPF